MSAASAAKPNSTSSLPCRCSSGSTGIGGGSTRSWSRSRPVISAALDADVPRRRRSAHEELVDLQGGRLAVGHGVDHVGVARRKSRRPTKICGRLVRCPPVSFTSGGQDVPVLRLADGVDQRVAGHLEFAAAARGRKARFAAVVGRSPSDVALEDDAVEPAVARDARPRARPASPRATFSRRNCCQFLGAGGHLRLAAAVDDRHAALAAAAAAGRPGRSPRR